MRTSKTYFSQVDSFRDQSMSGHWYFEVRSKYSTGFMPEQPTVDINKNLIQRTLSIMDISMRSCIQFCNLYKRPLLALNINNVFNY